MEILSYLNFAHDNPVFGAELGDVPYRLQIDYLAPILSPVTGISGLGLPTINPTNTYGAALQSGKQYDIIWVPAGNECTTICDIEIISSDPLPSSTPLGPLNDPVTGKDRTPKEEVEFIKHQAPGAKYIMSVCGGSVALATAGVLDGKRATTNKKFFRLISVCSQNALSTIFC